MSDTVLTEVSATVEPSRVNELLLAFDELVRQPTPDGLVRTELVEGDAGHWRIQTLWRDREALMAMRSSGEPAAPALFRSVGADPSLSILHVARSHRASTRD